MKTDTKASRRSRHKSADAVPKETHKPLKSRRIFLDLRGYRGASTFEQNVRLLGATVEKCFSKEIQILITNKGTPKDYEKPRSKNGATSAASPATPSPFNLAGIKGMDSPQADSPGEAVSKPVMTRGQAIAMKAHLTKNTGSGNMLDNAKKWNIKVIHIQQALNYVEREISKIPQTAKDHMRSRSSTQLEREKSSKPTHKVKRLRSKYIKFESVTRHYRPMVQHFDTFPRLNTSSVIGTCPFDRPKPGAPPVAGELAGDLERAEREERDKVVGEEDDNDGLKELEDGDTGNTANTGELGSPNTDSKDRSKGTDTKGQRSKVKEKHVEKNDKLTEKYKKRPSGGSYNECSRIYTKGELRRIMLDKIRAEQKRGYCEVCDVKYDDIDKHVRSDQHKKFARDGANFHSLDTMIAQGPNMTQFLNDVLEYQQMQDGISACTDDVLLIPEKPSPPSSTPEEDESTTPYQPPPPRVSRSRPATRRPEDIQVPQPESTEQLLPQSPSRRSRRKSVVSSSQETVSRSAGDLGREECASKETSQGTGPDGHENHQRKRNRPDPGEPPLQASQEAERSPSCSTRSSLRKQPQLSSIISNNSLPETEKLKDEDKCSQASCSVPNVKKKNAMTKEMKSLLESSWTQIVESPRQRSGRGTSVDAQGSVTGKVALVPIPVAKDTAKVEESCKDRVIDASSRVQNGLTEAPTAEIQHEIRQSSRVRPKQTDTTPEDSESEENILEPDVNIITSLVTKNPSKRSTRHSSRLDQHSQAGHTAEGHPEDASPAKSKHLGADSLQDAAASGDSSVKTICSDKIQTTAEVEIGNNLPSTDDGPLASTDCEEDIEPNTPSIQQLRDSEAQSPLSPWDLRPSHLMGKASPRLILSPVSGNKMTPVSRRILGKKTREDSQLTSLPKTPSKTSGPEVAAASPRKPCLKESLMKSPLKHVHFNDNLEPTKPDVEAEQAHKNADRKPEHNIRRKVNVRSRSRSPISETVKNGLDENVVEVLASRRGKPCVLRFTAQANGNGTEADNADKLTPETVSKQRDLETSVDTSTNHKISSKPPVSKARSITPTNGTSMESPSRNLRKRNRSQGDSKDPVPKGDDVCSPSTPRKRPDAKSSATSPPDSQSSQRVKLKSAWRIASNRSISQMLGSEGDQADDFEGFDISQNTTSDMLSDLSFEEVTEVNIERNWVIEDCLTTGDQYIGAPRNKNGWHGDCDERIPPSENSFEDSQDSPIVLPSIAMLMATPEKSAVNPRHDLQLTPVKLAALSQFMGGQQSSPFKHSEGSEGWDTQVDSFIQHISEQSLNHRSSVCHPASRRLSPRKHTPTASPKHRQRVGPRHELDMWLSKEETLWLSSPKKKNVPTSAKDTSGSHTGDHGDKGTSEVVKHVACSETIGGPRHASTPHRPPQNLHKTSPLSQDPEHTPAGDAWADSGEKSGVETVDNEIEFNFSSPQKRGEVKSVDSQKHAQKSRAHKSLTLNEESSCVRQSPNTRSSMPSKQPGKNRNSLVKRNLLGDIVSDTRREISLPAGESVPKTAGSVSGSKAPRKYVVVAETPFRAVDKVQTLPKSDKVSFTDKYLPSHKRKLKSPSGGTKSCIVKKSRNITPEKSVTHDKKKDHSASNFAHGTDVYDLCLTPKKKKEVLTPALSSPELDTSNHVVPKLTPNSKRELILKYQLPKSSQKPLKPKTRQTCPSPVNPKHVVPKVTPTKRMQILTSKARSVEASTRPKRSETLACLRSSSPPTKRKLRHKTSRSPKRRRASFRKCRDGCSTSYTEIDSDADDI